MTGPLKCEVYRQPAVVTLLHRDFGPRLSWPDFLADAIRRDVKLHGLTLLPCAYLAGGHRRPVYALADVDAFIADLRRVLSREPLEILTVEIPVMPGWVPASFCSAVILASRCAP